MPYRLEIKKSAKKQIAALPKPDHLKAAGHSGTED
jgi:hypothetical protein